MEINRQSGGLPLNVDRAPKVPGTNAPAASERAAHKRTHSRERRRQPDRRRRQIVFEGEEKRRGHRRRPDLLNARDGRPESLGQRRGRFIQVQV